MEEEREKKRIHAYSVTRITTYCSYRRERFVFKNKSDDQTKQLHRPNDDDDESD